MKHKLLCVAVWLHVWLRVQLLVAAAACVAVEFLAVFERNVRKGLALHVERKPFGRVNVTPACAGLGSLVDDLLEQVGACLGECELAEARIDGSEVGVDDLVESVVLHDVSFRSAWRRISVVFLSSGRCRKSCLFFCCFSAGGVAVSPRVGCGSGFLSGSCRIMSLCSVVPSL